MRVVVLGALDSQARLLENEFPHIDLRFAHKDSQSNAVDQMLFNNADRVLAMTKFISHAQYRRVPTHKLVYINGGMTALRSVLQTLDTACKLEAEQEKARHIEHTMAVAAGLEMKVDMDKIDFSAMKKAKTGDVLEYLRPEGMPAHTFVYNVAGARSYYKKVAGIHSEQEVSGGKATVLITRGVDFVEPIAIEAIVDKALDAARSELKLVEQSAAVQESIEILHGMRAMFTGKFLMALDAGIGALTRLDSDTAVKQWLKEQLAKFEEPGHG